MLKKSFSRTRSNSMNKEIGSLADGQTSIQTLPINPCMEKQDSKAINGLKPTKKQTTNTEQRKSGG